MNKVKYTHVEDHFAEDLLTDDDDAAIMNDLDDYGSTLDILLRYFVERIFCFRKMMLFSY